VEQWNQTLLPDATSSMSPSFAHLPFQALIYIDVDRLVDAGTGGITSARPMPIPRRLSDLIPLFPLVAVPRVQCY